MIAAVPIGCADDRRRIILVISNDALRSSAHPMISEPYRVISGYFLYPFCTHSKCLHLLDFQAKIITRMGYSLLTASGCLFTILTLYSKSRQSGVVVSAVFLKRF